MVHVTNDEHIIMLLSSFPWLVITTLVQAVHSMRTMRKLNLIFLTLLVPGPLVRHVTRLHSHPSWLLPVLIKIQLCHGIPCMSGMKKRTHFVECRQIIYPRHHMVINPCTQVLHMHRLIWKWQLSHQSIAIDKEHVLQESLLFLARWDHWRGPMHYIVHCWLDHP